MQHKAEQLDTDYLKSCLDSFIDRSKFEKLESRLQEYVSVENFGPLAHSIELIELRLGHLVSQKQMEEKQHELLAQVDTILREKYITEERFMSIFLKLRNQQEELEQYLDKVTNQNKSISSEIE